MQTAVSSTKRQAEPYSRPLNVASSSEYAEYASPAVVQPVFTHRRGRKHLNPAWRFNLFISAVVTVVVVISLLLQA